MRFDALRAALADRSRIERGPGQGGMAAVIGARGSREIVRIDS